MITFLIIMAILLLLAITMKDDDHKCPKCKSPMECYGSIPWGKFTYVCEKCGNKE